MVNDDIEVPTVDVVLTYQLCSIGLIDRGLQMLALPHKLTADVDERRMRSHGVAGEQSAFYQQVRIVAQDLPILAGTRLALVRINREIGRPGIVFRHKGPLEAGWETRPTASPQP